MLFRIKPIKPIVFLLLFFVFLTPTYGSSFSSIAPHDYIKEINFENDYQGITHTISEEKGTITLHWGKKNTGGYSIDIKDVSYYDNRLRVDYFLTHPTLGEPVTHAITYPEDTAKLPEGTEEIDIVMLTEIIKEEEEKKKTYWEIPCEKESFVINKSDELKNHWAEEAIKNIVSQRPDVISGFPDGTVRPEENVTREQLIKMLIAGKDLKSGVNDKACFEDIENRWSENFIHAAISKKIIDPKKEGTRFYPSKKITRKDMAVYVTKALNYNTNDINNNLKFEDTKKLDDYYKKHIQVVHDKEILQGYPDKTFNPHQVLTRAEAFAVMERYLNFIE